MPSSDVKEWLRSKILADGQWFHRIRLETDFETPGWDDPMNTKLPYFGIPEDLRGMRVLDIGCCEGFFSFEAERRGAAEVVAIDPYAGFVRRFNWCRDYLDARTTAYLSRVYDLNPRTFGTFDMVFFFGVFYHLRHPLLALEKILSVCTGTMLMQTNSLEGVEPEVSQIPAVRETPMARFYPFGMPSGPNDTIHDPTVFFIPNAKCTEAMMQSTGFETVERISSYPNQLVFRARSPTQAPGKPPDETKAPWS